LRILTLLPDVRHVQESGALKADLDERRLHARKHPRDFADIDVAHEPRFAARSMCSSCGAPACITPTRVSCAL